jgi:hypothetical protein
MKTFKTFLPVFPGFYSTIFEPCEDSEIEYINEQRGEKGLPLVQWDAIQFDYKDYYNRVGAKACNYIENVLNDIFGVKNIDICFEAIQSPKFYNLTNDSINCTIKIDKNIVLEYLKKNKEALQPYFTDTYTSRDGFISSYAPHIDIWIYDYFTEIDTNRHIMGAILDAIILNEVSDPNEDMYYHCAEEIGNVSALNYTELVEGVTNE